MTFEYSLGPAHPSTDDSHQPRVHHHEHGDHRRGPGSLGSVAPIQLQCVQVLPRRDRRLEVAIAVMGLREELEPGCVGAPYAGAVGFFESIEGNTPFAPADRVLSRRGVTHVAL